MAAHEAVPLDAADEIRELDRQGYGRNQIASMTGINSSTVRAILEDRHKSFSAKLTTRQIQNMLNRAFPA